MLFKKKPIDRRSIPQEDIDAAQQREASPKYRKKIVNRFYKGYPETPFISEDREKYTQWLNEMDGPIPHPLVDRKMMTRYSDGLLPGHVYMLYWINKIHRKRIPSLFEYEYGICFPKELLYLTHLGYIHNGQVTDLGLKAVERHNDIIKLRHPDPLHTGSLNVKEYSVQNNTQGRTIPLHKAPSEMLIPSKDIPLLEAEFRLINKAIGAVTVLLSLPRLSVRVSSFEYGINDTHYRFAPLTKTGKDPKYPMSLLYQYKMKANGDIDQLGTLDYRQDGTIGKASLRFWHDHVGFFIELGQIDGDLIVTKIEQSLPLEQKRITIYKRF